MGIGNQRFIQLRPHLGVTEAWNSRFEYANSWWLSGAIINGDTLGWMPSDSYMLGIKDDEGQQPPVVFPNPANSSITFKFSDKLSRNTIIRIYDIFGKEVLNNSFSNTEYFNLDISSLADGIYFYSVNINNNTINGRFIKQTQ